MRILERRFVYTRGGSLPFLPKIATRIGAHQNAEAMAEAPDLRDKSLEELEEEITCAVCHGHYQEAKLLPCMHYCCRACIEKLAERSRGRPFPCPECRKDTTLPSGGAEQLQSAFFVERMKDDLDVYGKMAKAEGKVEAVCEMCSGGKAVAFCRHCAEEKRHQQLTLEPVTTADITYNPPSPDAIPGDLGKVDQIPQVCEIADLLSIELGKPSQMISLKASVLQVPNIQAELKSLVNPTSSVQADVLQKGVGVYNITCTPHVRGRHDLTVKVNGEDIVGSPFQVFVKIHPTQLGPPVRTITRVRFPWGIALNNKEQLVVSEFGGRKVSIMERDGKRVQTIECDKLLCVCGVATGPDGAIYVTDIAAHCLFKFNKKGTLLKTVQNELKCPYFIKNIKNQLYVSDHDNNLVKIFDTDCNVIGAIPTNECPKPEGIAEGDDGLYVVGGDKIGVYSCVPNGDFIRHLNVQSSSVKLSNPRGIVFDCSGHLFVTQTGDGVHVFTPSGEHVASFGLASSGVLIWDPAGIVIDEDGFVYAGPAQAVRLVRFWPDQY